MSKYRKTITAVVTGAIGWGTQVVASAPATITAPEVISGLTILAIALGVYAVKNEA
jgi:hypothetical protein